MNEKPALNTLKFINLNQLNGDKITTLIHYKELNVEGKKLGEIISKDTFNSCKCFCCSWVISSINQIFFTTNLFLGTG